MRCKLSCVEVTILGGQGVKDRSFLADSGSGKVRLVPQVDRHEVVDGGGFDCTCFSYELRIEKLCGRLIWTQSGVLAIYFAVPATPILMMFPRFASVGHN